MGRALPIGLLLVALAGCAQTSFSVTSPGLSTSAAPSAVTVRLGHAVTVTSDSGTATLTVLSVRYHQGGAPPISASPINGRFAVADVLVKVSAGSYDYNEANIGYQTPDQRVYGFADGHAAIAGYGPGLNSGTLQAGQSVRGFVTFDVPNGPGQDVQVSDPGGSIVAQWRLR